MDKNWMPLQSFPSSGKELLVDDQRVWLEFFNEFGLGCRILGPLRAEMFVLPQAQGVLVRGLVIGKVAMACNRCAGDSVVEIRHKFDSFEPFPGAVPIRPGEREGRERAGAGRGAKAGALRTGRPQREDADQDPGLEVDEAVMRLSPHGGGIEINLAALAWEEFSLSLPVKPLCREDCKGLCPVCGKNRNLESCSCRPGGGDPRLAALRGLKLESGE